MRGSLTIGLFYPDEDKKIFLGEALIDAYEYGEKQNWIGFILTPKVYSHFEGTELRLDKRPYYRPVDLKCLKYPKCIKHLKYIKYLKCLNADNVYAFAFNNGAVNGKNPYLEAILKMKQNSAKKYAEKYENTENFIKKHK